MFKGDLDKSAFLDDLKTQSAILHQLLVLGEAVKRLSEGFQMVTVQLMKIGITLRLARSDHLEAGEMGRPRHAERLHAQR